VFWPNVVVIGLTVGSIYALYGLGITLIYKATRVPNFAHGAIGMLGAYLFFKTWERSQDALRIKTVTLRLPFIEASKLEFVPPSLPMWAAFVVALGGIALVGLLVSRVLRPLEGAPTVLLIVATLGLASIVTGFVSDWFSPNAEIVPQVVPEGYHTVGGVTFSNDAVAFAAVSLALAFGFGAFFRRTNLGIAIRATADSREVSRLLGINANAVAGFAWAVGSMLAAVAAVLLTPRNQLDQAYLFTLIVPGFAAALFGGFTSLIGTFCGGLVLGLVESVVIAAPWPEGFLQQLFTKAGTSQMVGFVVIVAVLMTRPPFIFKGIRVEEESGVGLARTKAGLGPEDDTRRRLDRIGALPVLLRDWMLGRWLLAGMIVAAFLGVAGFAVSYWSTVLASGVVFSVIALSVIVLTGWTGQISVAPLTFAGAGAWATALVAGNLGLPFWLAILAGGLVGVPIALIVGIPALRLRGFFLAIATMAFALAAERWLFTLPALTDRNKIPRGVLSEQLSQPIFLVSLLVAGLLFLGLRNLAGTRVARAWYALRDSENTAIAMGIDPVRYKLLAFVVSGFVAGIGGALFGYVNRILYAPSFSLQFSLSYVLFAVIAGVGELFGAFLVGVFQVLPAIFAAPASGVNQAPFILAGVNALVIAILYPNGLAAFYRRLVRPFHPSERIAWASAEGEEEQAPAAAVASQTEIDLTEVAERVEREHVAVTGG
jgi:branched-chain amino acid transport system permease protein